MSGAKSEQTVRVEPAVAGLWPDVVTVMGTRGDPASCWCQFFRLRGQAWHDATKAENKAALCEQVESSPTPPGVLAYRDDEPVGWCAVGPKRDQPRLLASRLSAGEVAGIWSVTCFVVKVGHRRQGIAGALLTGAIALARAQKATTVEAYAVDASVRTSVSAAELFHGPLTLFTEAGFTEVARPSPTRAVVRLDL
ncbi:GNAT family N-acetyltransferase [Phytomonospora endophytica]|uniref:GNAT superfamily N-acetyltransferase n=1 Tax=Phytomonospora endophytica TaxID=714109 RepID=A0A841FSK4_9ACTN|nr:GNAT family N-acetyltransferase [Phytomonospora endophytica]MBB6036738.1 GNAT superfamily N-acetyltransferase [Phytomonospora endophytica]